MSFNDNEKVGVFIFLQFSGFITITFHRVDRFSNLVYCDGCGSTWYVQDFFLSIYYLLYSFKRCERCLKEINEGHSCDETNAILLCIQYQSITDEKRARADEKHPWLKAYLSWKASDESSVKEWVFTNASFCPRCNEAIEKIEGCFHVCIILIYFFFLFFIFR
jgi:hypothetical protein